MSIRVYLSGSQDFYLKRAILSYESKSGKGGFATVHKVRASDDGPPIILPGKEVTAAFVKSLRRVLDKNFEQGPKPFQWTNTRILGSSSDKLMWHCPSQRRKMYFRTTGAAQALSGLTFRHPHLLFIGTGRDLDVFALAHPTRRPGMMTPVYTAPYYNVGEDGDLCWGSVKPPDTADPDNIAKIEEIFFESHFTHINGNVKLVNHPGGFVDFWNAMTDEAISRVPTEWLVSTKQRVKHLIGR